MGDEHEGDPHLLLQSPQLDLHLLAQSLVQRAQRLIQQQHFGPLDQCPCKRYPLPLPSGELIGAPLAEPLQLYQSKGTLYDSIELGLGELLPAQAISEILSHVQVRKNRVVLKHHVHRSAVCRHRRHRLTIDEHLSLRGRLEPGENSQQRRLAASRRPEEREEFPFLHLDVDGLERPHPSEMLGDVAKRYEAALVHQTPSLLCRSPRRFRRRTYSAAAITIVEAARIQEPRASTLGSF